MDNLGCARAGTRAGAVSAAARSALPAASGECADKPAKSPTVPSKMPRKKTSLRPPKFSTVVARSCGGRAVGRWERGREAARRAGVRPPLFPQRPHLLRSPPAEQRKTRDQRLRGGRGRGLRGGGPRSARSRRGRRSGERLRRNGARTRAAMRRHFPGTATARHAPRRARPAPTCRRPLRAAPCSSKSRQTRVARACARVVS